MIATAKLRRRAGQRISSALWALLVIGAGALMIATLSGYDIDLQLILIIVLGALGLWLLLSAAVSGIGRQKQVARATAPVVEEPAVKAPPTARPAASKHADGFEKTPAAEAAPVPPTQEDPAVNKSDSAKDGQAAKPVASAKAGSQTKRDPATPAAATTGDDVPAGASESLKPDSVSKRPTAAKRKPTQSKSAKPANRKPANRKVAAKKPAADGQSVDSDKATDKDLIDTEPTQDTDSDKD